MSELVFGEILRRVLGAFTFITCLRSRIHQSVVVWKSLFESFEYAKKVFSFHITSILYVCAVLLLRECFLKSSTAVIGFYRMCL